MLRYPNAPVPMRAGCPSPNQSSFHGGRSSAAAGAGRTGAGGRRFGCPPDDPDAPASRLLLIVDWRVSMRWAILRFSEAICSIRWRSFSRDAFTLRPPTRTSLRRLNIALGNLVCKGATHDF